MKLFFFSPILANNNQPLKIYCENIMIIYTNFNLNVLLQLFFSLSKQIIFFSPILTNNNLPLKIYYESIVKTFVIKIDTYFNLNVLSKGATTI